MAFYLPERTALKGQDPLELDLDRDWQVFGTGLYVWILQTFLRLRAAGAPVSLAEVPPALGTIVAFADHVERLLSEAPSPGDVVVVSVRADRRPQLIADFEIVQNAASVGGYQVFIPHWIQPGLIPRDTDRGARLVTAAFLGARQQLHEELATAGWVDELGKRGIHWEDRSVTFEGNDHVYGVLDWRDYSQLDVIVALRPPGLWNAASKPAAKLQNAWAAGVPAILTPEEPYRELRRSDLDYLEVQDSAEALAALERLRDDPDLYVAMVRNGLKRAHDFQPDRLIERWSEALWRDIPRRTQTPRGHALRRMRRYRALARRARLPITWKEEARKRNRA